MLVKRKSYFVSVIRYYLEYSIKKHEKVTDNPAVRIYVNKIENKITCKIKTQTFNIWNGEITRKH